MKGMNKSIALAVIGVIVLLVGGALFGVSAATFNGTIGFISSLVITVGIICDYIAFKLYAYETVVSVLDE